MNLLAVRLRQPDFSGNSARRSARTATRQRSSTDGWLRRHSYPQVIPVESTRRSESTHADSGGAMRCIAYRPTRAHTLKRLAESRLSTQNRLATLILKSINLPIGASPRRFSVRRILKSAKRVASNGSSSEGAPSLRRQPPDTRLADGPGQPFPQTCSWWLVGPFPTFSPPPREVLQPRRFSVRTPPQVGTPFGGPPHRTRAASSGVRLR
jgi:hypothetical protein